MTEAFVGQEMIAYSSPQSQRQLYYWHREARSSNAEVDYLSELDDTIIPIEVKSGSRGRLKSMRRFLDENGALSPFGIRFSSHAYSVLDDLRSLPLYAVSTLTQR